MKFDPAEFGKQIAAVTKAAIEKATAALSSRIESLVANMSDHSNRLEELEKRQFVSANEVKALIDELPKPKDGIDGKSIDLEDVRPMLQEMVDALPKPKDGIDGKSVDPEDLRPILQEMVEALPKPVDGKSIDLEDVRPMLQEMVDALPKAADGKSVTIEDVLPALLEQMPKPKDGIDGKSIDLEDVRPMLQEMVDALPKPKDGAPGKSVTIEDVRPIIEEAVAEIPKPQDGKSVTVDDVRPIIEELVSAIPKPRDGIDGKSVEIDDVKDMLLARLAEWMLDFEKRAQDRLQKAIDELPKPKDGKDGRDGVGFDDIDVVYDGKRSMSVRFVRGNVVKEFPFKLSNLVYHGVWKDGNGYESNDVVTWDGSLWRALKDAPKYKPGSQAGQPEWQLIVKRGANGRDGEKGAKGRDGVDGKNGRDLTHLLPDGSRY